MLERQREGVAKAKAAGKYKGRKPIASDRQQEVLSLISQHHSKASIAWRLEIDKTTIYRILKKKQK